MCSQSTGKVKGEREDRLRFIVDKIPALLAYVDPDGRFRFASAKYRDWLGVAPDEMYGKHMREVFGPDVWTVIGPRVERALSGEQVTFERSCDGRPDSPRWLRVHYVPDVEGGEKVGFYSLVTDISRQRELAEQLQHSQKMEAIGRLASGIAHDFNNLLMGLTGSVSLALKELDATHPARQYLEQAKQAADRGANLTEQLQTVSAKREVDPAVVDLNKSVLEAEQMLRRLIGEHIDLELDLCASPVAANCSRGEFEQVIMNLVVNARDAVQEGGSITINSSLEVIGEDDSPPLDLTAGRYAVLEVVDTGCGMDPETQSRAFEPFFTTKSKTKGTGLGLSNVYGIVRRRGGDVQVDSEVGEGTRIWVYLPVAEEPVREPSREPEGGDIESTDATILAIEDEELVRLSIQGFLEEDGHEVHCAEESTEAAELIEELGTEIDLVVSDVMLPEESGPAFMEKVLEDFPDLDVVFVSAHSKALLVEEERVDADCELLQKPFSAPELQKRVNEVIRGSSGCARLEQMQIGAPGADQAADEKEAPGILLVDDESSVRFAVAELLEDLGYVVLTAENGAGAIEALRNTSAAIDGAIIDHHLPDTTGVEIVEVARECRSELPIVYASGTGPENDAIDSVLSRERVVFVAKPYDIDDLNQELRTLLGR